MVFYDAIFIGCNDLVGFYSGVIVSGVLLLHQFMDSSVSSKTSCTKGYSHTSVSLNQIDDNGFQIFNTWLQQQIRRITFLGSLQCFSKPILARIGHCNTYFSDATYFYIVVRNSG
ncbi:hypothetical protein OUZ56_024707 [Daphnia magna]|uniref:Uncharacterized protein n=1 Tax=Daphnia magna TaxID=35525 RepID=A0ABQ9ZHR8_9CRUS|nr:hypothetical protein OUZ56_024707 [Daphnia magna]